mgnify:FL=1
MIILLSNRYTCSILKNFVRYKNYNIHYRRHIHYNNDNNNNKIFTPLNYSFNIHSNLYHQNIIKLQNELNNINNNNNNNSQKNQIDFSNTINHIKSIRNYIPNLIPKSGSFIHFKNINNKNNNLDTNFGIVLNDINYSLSNFIKLNVLLPNGNIIEIDSSNIIFLIDEFINKSEMKILLKNTNRNDINFQFSKTNLIHLTLTLNIFLLFFIEISNKLLQLDLIRTNYFKNAEINYQSSLNLINFTNQLYANSKTIQNLTNIKINPFGIHSLLLSVHFLIYNDPIHFRFLNNNNINNNNNNYNNNLNPLNQLTSNYFLNPILLSQNLENIYIQHNDLINRAYYDILKKSNNFQLFNIYKSDENFKRLILLIRYSIIYPNDKIFNKLSNLLPIEEEINARVLYNYLIEIGIYNLNTNPILSSGIYGFNIKNINDISLVIENINELQYSFNKNMLNDLLPKHLRSFKPLKLIENDNIDEFNRTDEITETNEKNKFRNRNFSDSFIKYINKSLPIIWNDENINHDKNNLNDNNTLDVNYIQGDTDNDNYTEPIEIPKNRTIYKLDDNIAFSVDYLSMTMYKFNIFIPIPDQSPNNFITTHEPINLNKDTKGNLDSFPKINFFNHSIRINQPCIKLSFIHNLIDSNSLTNPKIKVGIDCFKTMEKADDEWFVNRNVMNLNGSKRKMNCWLSLNKLLNFLIEKEKSRIRLGYLKTYKNFDKNDDNLRYFTDNINNREINHKHLNDNDQYDENIFKDKKWIIDNLRLVIDENLSRFCNDKKISVINRSLNKIINNSIDYRIFKKFKIFKWYANSYETFGFQLSSNPGDLTALVGCLSFLGKCEVQISNRNMSIDGNFNNNNNSMIQKGYLPLGLKYYSSFTLYNFMETHLNLWQLFRYLIIETIEKLKDNNIDIKWDPNRLEKVTEEHFNKCVSQSEGYIEIINKFNRYEILKNIEKEENDKNIISDGTNINKDNEFTLMRCIVIKIEKERIIGYWVDKDIEVELDMELNNKITIGDRIICSKIVTIDAIEDKIVLK